MHAYLILCLQLHSGSQNRGYKENTKPNMEAYFYISEGIVQWRLWQVGVLFFSKIYISLQAPSHGSGTDKEGIWW